ncbi:MAG TPA: cysteine hydrolase family protein [Acidobacteriota bacterium]|jgi:nicotinamidase/pyrazinamidase
MKKVVFWDVDTQYDFIMPDGKLCIPGAVDLLPRLARLTRTAQANHDRIQIIASMCDHEPSDAEISDQPNFRETFPPHCLRGSVGQMKVLSTEPAHPWIVTHEKLPALELQRRLSSLGEEIVILKKMFDVFSNPNTEPIVQHLDPEEIYLYGVALDVCDAHAIQGLLRLRRRNIYLVRDATEAIDRARGNQLVEQWSQRGVSLVNSDEVCRKFERA